MLELITIISTVAPGLASVLAIIAFVLVGANKLSAIICQFKNDKDKLVAALTESDSQYKAKLEKLIEQNDELTRTNKILTDCIAHTRGYTDIIMNNKKEG
jgi:hypothetical protein